MLWEEFPDIRTGKELKGDEQENKTSGIGNKKKGSA